MVQEVEIRAKLTKPTFFLKILFCLIVLLVSSIIAILFHFNPTCRTYYIITSTPHYMLAECNFWHYAATLAMLSLQISCKTWFLDMFIIYLRTRYQCVLLNFRYQTERWKMFPRFLTVHTTKFIPQGKHHIFGFNYRTSVPEFSTTSNPQVCCYCWLHEIVNNYVVIHYSECHTNVCIVP
jgi:hypothetical protein